MAETTNPQFKLIVPITGYTIRKDAKGVEKYVLTGLASNTNLDLTGERMADSAITAMEKSIETNKIYLNNEHGSEWDADFGEVTRLWSTASHELMMEAELDPDHYRTKTLIKALDKGKKLGLSIGGYVKEAAREWFADAARMVMTYKDISLFHVAITGTPAVADTWVTPITKSVKDWKEMPMPNDKTTKSDEVVETPAVEEVAAVVTGADEAPVAAVEESETEVVTPKHPWKHRPQRLPLLHLRSLLPLKRKLSLLESQFHLSKPPWLHLPGMANSPFLPKATRPKHPNLIPPKSPTLQRLRRRLKCNRTSNPNPHLS